MPLTTRRISLLLAAPIAAFAVQWLTAPTQAEAQATHVIEMFTSQGCSSCPPADKLLKTLAGQSNIIALSFHVDYWDRLGWKDTFGSPAFTKRQRDYAVRRGDGQIYTPQAVIDGRRHEVGHNKSGIERAMASTDADVAAQHVSIEVKVGGDKLAITIGDGAKASGGLVTLLGVQAQGAVTATRGENSGATLAYTNIVRTMKPLGTLNGAARYRFESVVTRDDPVLAGADAIVVLVHRSADGPIIGATKVDLK